MSRTALVAATLVASVALAGAAHADIVVLDDGRCVDGVPMRVEQDAIVVCYRHGEVRVPLTLVQDYFVEGAPPPEAKTDEEKAQREKGLVRYEGRWMRPEQRQKLLDAAVAKRRREVEETKAHLEWRNRWTFSTKNFEFESTLVPTLNDDYSQLLETYFELFKKEWGVKTPKDWGKLKVCCYNDRATFNRVSGGRGGILAYYRFVAPRELDFYHDRVDPQMARACLYHEANHYLTDLMSETFQYPHWVNEAMAEYYGASEYDPATKKMTVGNVQEGRLVEVRTDIEAGKRVRLHDLVGSEKGDYEHYYWGWSFVHFMMETPAYQKRFKQFFVDLARARDVQRVRGDFGFEHVTGDECLRVFMKRMGISGSLDDLEHEWYAYIDGIKSSGVRGLEEAGMSAFQQGRWKFRAPRQLKAAIDAGSTSVPVHLYYARCMRLREDGREEALRIVDKACALDPLDADCWAERGYCLFALDRKDDAKRNVELAREMNPSESYLDIEVTEAIQEALGDN